MVSSTQCLWEVKSGLDQSTFIGVVGVWARLEGLRKELEVKSQQQQVQTTLLCSFVFKRVVEINYLLKTFPPGERKDRI